jgi:hypothetical protein
VVVTAAERDNLRALIDRAKRERCGLPTREEALRGVRRKAEHRTTPPKAEHVEAVRSAFAELGRGTVREAAPAAGLSVRVARRAVQELAEAGVLALTGRAGGRWKVYDFAG